MRRDLKTVAISVTRAKPKSCRAYRETVEVSNYRAGLQKLSQYRSLEQSYTARYARYFTRCQQQCFTRPKYFVYLFIRVSFYVLRIYLNYQTSFWSRIFVNLGGAKVKSTDSQFLPQPPPSSDVSGSIDTVSIADKV